MCKGHFLLFVSRVDRVDDINLENVFVLASKTRVNLFLTLRLFMRRMLFLSTSGIVVQSVLSKMKSCFEDLRSKTFQWEKKRTFE